MADTGTPARINTSTRRKVTEPLWRYGDKHKAKEDIRLFRKKQRANFCVEYDLVYDGGGAKSIGYYRTYWGARFGAFLNLHFRSWGGSAELFPYPKPIPKVSPQGPRKKRRWKILKR